MRHKLFALLVAVTTLTGTGLLGAPGAGAVPTYQAGLWPFTKLGLAAAHQQSTGAGITVGLLDGPVDPTVPELRGQKVVPAAKGFCRAPDGSYPSTATGPVASHATSLASLLVGSGHGTVSGSGIAGIAPGATLRTYTVGIGSATNASASSFSCTTPEGDATTQAAAAVRQAVADGVKIINLSIAGGAYHGQLLYALGEAEKAGVIVVAATYDQTTPGSVQPPATTNGAVVVNAVDSTGHLAPFSAGGSLVSVAAPGVGLDVGGFLPSWRSDAIDDGSSYAAPLVCGALALVWSKYPHATANQVIQDLLANPGLVVGRDAAGKPTYTNAFTRSPNAPPGYQQGNGYGYGIVDPLAMLAHDPAGYPDVNPLVRADGIPAPRTLGITAAGSASASVSARTPAPAAASSSPAAVAAGAHAGGGGGSGLAIIGVIAAVLVIAGIAFAVVRGRGSGRRAPAHNGTAS